MASSTGLYQGKVKQCLSGDTVVLQALNNPQSTRQLSLAYVDAPRIGRDREDPFAYESRDFIRMRLVGKVIQFRVLYSIPLRDGNKRDFCQITLQDGQQLPDLSIAEGYLKLREEAGSKEGSEELSSYIDKLRALEARAKADNKGLWDASAPKVQTSHELPDPDLFVEKWRGRSMEGCLVEYVGAGDRLIVRLRDSATNHYQVPVLLAGIRAPRLQRRTQEGLIVPGEPMADESQEFVTSRMLQRSCNVVLYGLSDQKQLVGSVLHVMGNIAEFLLKDGLARCFDAHTTMMGQDMAALRQAEKTARDKQLGIFRGAAAPKANAKQTEVTVSRVLNAETVFLRYPDGKERRVGLSSVRQPKPSDPKQSPYSAEAKEFLRRRLIGKHVKVAANGKREANEGFEERELVTISQNGKNVALELVEAGYASVIRHKMDDTDRSPDYDALRLAEDAAQKDAKGMWSTKPPETKTPVDYSESVEKAKRLLSLLQRQKRVPAVVDFVMGGSRFALLIPRENARLVFVLSGVQVPRSARKEGDTAEPFGQEAHDLASKRLMQRDVEVDVEENDKNGGFIGKLYVHGDSFSRLLLEEGFGSIRIRSAEKSGNLSELQAAERKAKEARRGIWHDYDPATDIANGTAEEDASSAPTTNGTSTNGTVQQAPPSTDFRDIYITHVDPSTCRLRFQTIGRSTTSALDTLTSQLRSLNLDTSASPLPGPPKVGDTVLARFTADKAWYRARVRRVDRDAKSAEVLYADFGNSEPMPWDQLRQLPQPDRFGPTALRFQAQEAVLSFLTFPSASEYLEDAASWLSRRTSEGKFVARVDATEKDGTLSLSVFDPNERDEEDNGAGPGVEYSFLNKEVVGEGLAMVLRKLRYWERAQGATLKVLRGREEEAKEAKYGMWEYGDLTED